MLIRTALTLASLFCVTVANAQSQITVCDAARDLSLIGKQGWYFLPLSLASSGDFLPDPSLPYLKRLSDLLKSGGTTLILAPTPSKAAVYSSFLPEDYRKTFSWDPNLFRNQYSGSINRLRNTGVLVVDLFKVADQMLYSPQLQTHLVRPRSGKRTQRVAQAQRWRSSQVGSWFTNFSLSSVAE